MRPSRRGPDAWEPPLASISPLTPSTARAAALAALIFLAYVLLELSAGLNNPIVEAVDTLVFPALGFVYVPLGALAAVKARGRLRVAWAVMTLGLAAWAVGEILTAYYEFADEEPFPSWADVGYLLYIPCVAAALMLFPGAGGWRHRGRLVLDGFIVTASFLMISWLAVMRTIWLSDGSRGVEFALSLAYPAGDVLILTLGVLVLIRTTRGLRPTLMLLVAGLGCAALADSLWSYLINAPDRSVTALTDILYVANALLIIVALVAAQHARPSALAVGVPPGRLSLWLPLLPVAFASVFLATANVAAVTETPVVITGVLLIAATLLRQYLEAADLVKRQQQARHLAGRLSSELDSAARYVASILPGDLAGPVTVCSRYLPSRAVGGDSFGYSWVDDDHLVVYLIDVSGHGVEPAMLSVSVHNVLRSGSLSTAVAIQPDTVLSELNSRFSMDKHGDHYFTMWYGVYQRSTGLLRHANAGHPPPLVLSREDRTVDGFVPGGASMPVGMFNDTEFGVESYAIPGGAQLLLYSDGVLGEPPCPERLLALCAEVDAEQGCWLDALIPRLPPTDDDRSLVLLEFPNVASAKSGSAWAR